MNEFLVTEKSMRPASNLRECFYCHSPVGFSHKDDCVLILKKVRVLMEVEYEVNVPAHWEAYDIEFHRNEGTWCSNNAIYELKNYFGKEKDCCMCEFSRFRCLDADVSEPFLDE